MKRKFFGTDGIRGVANVFPLTGEMIYKVSKAAAKVLKKRSGFDYVFIGKDTRLSCDMLEAAVSAGLMSEGVNVYRLGVVPTPALAYLTKKRKALFGVMITASHNPFYDNGIKFIGPDGFKLPDEIEMEIEKLIDERDESEVTHRYIGRNYEKYNYIDDYTDYVISLAQGYDFSNLNVLIDCANGATSYVIPEIMERLNINYMIIDNNPTGDNINNECGSTNMNKIKRIIKEENFDCAIAFDGDGDRCLMVDEKGEEMDGDVIMALYFTDKIKNDPNFNGKIVATVMSNMGFKNVIKNYGGTYIETKVGDKYVLSEMLKNGAVVGGEQSGHVIYLDKNTTGDGIISAIEMLKIRAKREKPFSELVKETGYKKYPQYLHNVKVRKKEGLWDIDSINKKVKEFEETFKNSGRILIRPSGTEPLIRVMVEAEDMEKAKVFVKDISDIIEKELG